MLSNALTVLLWFILWKCIDKNFTSDRISPNCALEDDVSHEFRRNEGSSEIGFSKPGTSNVY